MTINRGYSPNHKYWDRDLGRITPNVEHSESVRPHTELLAAPWLPVQRQDEYIQDYFVISYGKVAALDRAGDVVPAGLRKAFNVAAGSTILTYTATDVSESVVDLTTGAAVSAATSYTEAEVTAALKERGLIRPTERAMDFVSKPIGITSYNVHKSAGSDNFNPANLTQHNWRPQANIAITCDYVATYPLVPSLETTETMNGALANLAGSIDWSTTRTGGWFGSTALNGLVKYSSVIAAGDDVVGYVFEKFPNALDTTETPISTSVTNGLVNEVSAVTAINAAGDYFIDYDLGILFLYEAGGNAIPSPFSVAATITYYTYQDVYDANQITTYACATGNLNFGDFLTYDTNSNLILANLDIGTAEGYDATGALYAADPDYSADADAAISLQLQQAINNHVFGVVGQVIGVETYPDGALDRVRTAFDDQTLAASYRAPGTATRGRSDQLTYAGAAETMLLVNLIMR